MTTRTTSAGLGHYLGHLLSRFEEQAEWRRGKAEVHPDDAARNLAAASVFDRLAATCKDVSPQWADAYEKLWAGANVEDASAQENDIIRPIGIAYANAEEFIKDVVDRVQRRAA